MYGQIATLAFVGVEARPVEVQVRITPGQPAFHIVGLPDKAVAESRERVRNALHAVGLGLPYKHITVNLAPADLPKEGSHFDLPIVLAMMVRHGGDRAGRDLAASPPSANWPRRRHSRGTGCTPRRDRRQRALARASSAPRPAARRRPGPAIKSTFSRRRTCCRWSITSRACRRCRGPSPISSARARRCPTLPTSKARRVPSACSRSRRPADTTC